MSDRTTRPSSAGRRRSAARPSDGRRRPGARGRGARGRHGGRGRRSPTPPAPGGRRPPRPRPAPRAADAGAEAGAAPEPAAEDEAASKYLALAQRKQADFENFRKRMAREAAAAADRGVGRLAKELLPALDHLELALQARRAARRRRRSGSRASGSCRRSSPARSAASASRRYSPQRRALRPQRARGDGPAARRGRRVRHRRRGLPARLPAQRHGAAARARRGRRSRQDAPMARASRLLQGPRGRQEGVRRRHQEGLPQARAPVPPGPQPGRHGGRGALQGDLRGPRRPLGPREAQEVRPRRLAFPGGNPFGGGGAARRAAAPTRARSRDILSRPVRQRHGRRARRRRRARSPRQEKGRDLETEVSISFAQAVAGAQVPVAVATHSACPTCRGTGAEPGTPPIVCPVCQGRGVESQGQGLFSITRPCSRCNGSGTVIEQPCPTCDGEGRQRELKRYKVNIPAGVKDGSRIRLAGKGEAGLRGGPPGDLYVVTRVRSRPSSSARATTSRSRSRSRSPRRCAAPRSRCRRSTATKTLRVAPGTRHGTVQRLRGEGPPRLDGSGRGDIHYRFVIDVPSDLTEEQRELVDALSAVMNGNPRERILRDAEPAEGGAARWRAPTTHDDDHRDGGHRARRLHDLRRRRARRDAPADAAHVRAARPDRAQALAQGHAPVLPGRRRAAAPHPADDRRARA